jgi:hypothetical protein
MATKVTEGYVVTLVDLKLELPAPLHNGPLLLGSSNNSTKPGNKVISRFIFL